MRRPTRPEPVRAVPKVLLVDRFEHHDHRPLKNLVLEGRYPDRTRGRAIGLRDVGPSHGRRLIEARLGSVQQVLQVLFQVLCVCLCRLVVHAYGAVLARAPIGFAQPVQVDVVVEGGEAHLRRLPRPRCYRLLFR
jgi:hypothetical protein